MSYEKHNWTDNETITAAKLNNIEDGIEEAAQSGGGGGENPCYIATTKNFPVSSNLIATFIWVTYDDGAYYEADCLSSFRDGIQIYGNTTGAWFSSMPIPRLDGHYLALSLNSGIQIESSSGGISQAPVQVTNWGNVYIVTGDFEVTFNGWL